VAPVVKTEAHTNERLQAAKEGVILADAYGRWREARARMRVDLLRRALAWRVSYLLIDRYTGIDLYIYVYAYVYIYIYMYIEIFNKTKTFLYVLYMYIYIYIYVYMCVCI